MRLTRSMAPSSSASNGSTRAAATLYHPNIITIYDAGSHESRPFLVMEHVDGESVSRLIDRRDLAIDAIPERFDTRVDVDANDIVPVAIGQDA